MLMRYATALSLLLCLAGPSLAEPLPYVTSQQLDLTRLLAPPPAADSQQTRSEIQEILKVQATRTAAMEAAAKADQVEDVFRFANVLGAKFKAENLPLATPFFER